jgi:hypothetical protein
MCYMKQNKFAYKRTEHMERIPENRTSKFIATYRPHRNINVCGNAMNYRLKRKSFKLLL